MFFQLLKSHWYVFLIAAAVGVFILVAVIGGSETNNNDPNIALPPSEQIDEEEPKTLQPLPNDELDTDPGNNQNRGNQPNVPRNRAQPSENDIEESEEEAVGGAAVAASRAAFYHLPYRSRTLRADYENQLSNGDLMIVVRYRGSRSAAEKEWKRFLNKHGDPGTSYLVVYKIE